MSDEPGAAATGSSLIRQGWTYTQVNQHRPTAAWGFPLPPQRRPKAQPNPASQIDQQVRCLAESEVATPTPHIRGQSRHRRLQTHTLGLPRDFPNPLLEPLDRLRRDPAPNHASVGETESEELPLLRSRHRALLLVNLELESLRDESLATVHHPLTRSSAALRFPFEFLEREIADAGRKSAGWRGPFHAGTDRPVPHRPGVQDRPNE